MTPLIISDEFGIIQNRQTSPIPQKPVSWFGLFLPFLTARRLQFFNCLKIILKLHNHYYYTYKENEINDDDATPQENDDQAENETE